MVTLAWHASKHMVLKRHQRYILIKGCPPVAFGVFSACYYYISSKVYATKVKLIHLAFCDAPQRHTL